MANKNLGLVDGSLTNTTSLETQNGLFWFIQRDGSRDYYVLSEDLNQTAAQVEATAGIPQVGDTLDGVPVRKAKAKDTGRVMHNGTPKVLWVVTVETDSRVDTSSSSGAGDEDPTDMRPRRRWYTQKEKMRIDKDINGDPIETANGEPIIYERGVIKSVLEIERYEAYPFDPTVHEDFANHSNDAAFYGFPIGTAIIDDIQSDEEVINGVTYCKVRYIIFFLLLYEDGVLLENTYADVSFLHQGYLVRSEVGAIPSTDPDKHGHPRKINLDEDGVELPDGDPPVFIIFPDIPLADFDTLNLFF